MRAKLRIPVPNAKQRQAMAAQEKYIAYGGARGGGKSWFVRVKADLGGIEAAFGNVHFVSIPGADPAEYAFPTEPMSAKALAEAGQGLEITAAYRILDE